jgi:hypothetical protein
MPDSVFPVGVVETTVLVNVLPLTEGNVVFELAVIDIAVRKSLIIIAKCCLSLEAFTLDKCHGAN